MDANIQSVQIVSKCHKKQRQLKNQTLLSPVQNILPERIGERAVNAVTEGSNQLFHDQLVFAAALDGRASSRR